MRVQIIGSGASLKKADLEAINRLMTQLSERAKPVTFDDVSDVIEHSQFFILRDDMGALRGMASLAICCKLSGREGRVEEVVVDESFRGRGGGKALLMALIDRARELGLASLLLTSSARRVAAQRLYLSVGFSQYQTDVFGLRL